jgi:hypothetical protein
LIGVDVLSSLAWSEAPSAAIGAKLVVVDKIVNQLAIFRRFRAAILHPHLL